MQKVVKKQKTVSHTEEVLTMEEFLRIMDEKEVATERQRIRGFLKDIRVRKG